MSEFWHIMIKYCEIEPNEIFELPIKGLFLLVMESDINIVNIKFSKVLEENRFQLLYCKKVTPLERIAKSNLSELEPILNELLPHIPQNTSWRIVVNKRHTALKKNDIINKIATHPLVPNGKVDLENAEWDINIEIFGEWMGVSVQPRGSVLSI